MNKHEIYEKIISKKEFSQLIKEDVERAIKKFEKRDLNDEEKVKLVRELLRKVFAFGSEKLLNRKILDKKSPYEILKKHFSTRERLSYYKEVYSRLLADFDDKEISVIDFGAGINGLSYGFFNELNFKVNYAAVEAVGQFVELMNYYFKKENLNGKSIHESLFNLEKIKEIIKIQKKPRIIFLFKTLDSLEMLERNYSKKLVKEISLLAEKIVVSFATKSLGARKKFKVQRYWFENFLSKENFKILDDFESSDEHYIVFMSSE